VRLLAAVPLQPATQGKRARKIRYAALQRTFPEESKRLSAQLEEEFMARYEKLKAMAAVPAGEKEDK
jgi:hypothetical protein